MRKAARVLLVLAGVLVVLLAAGCLIPRVYALFLLDIAFQLTAGWLSFLGRELPRVQIDLLGSLTAAVCLVGLAVGLHLFLRWLHGQARQGARWRARWKVKTGRIL